MDWLSDEYRPICLDLSGSVAAGSIVASWEGSHAMSFVLLASITICLFATGGALYLLWRLGDWHLAFLAAMTALVGT